MDCQKTPFDILAFLQEDFDDDFLPDDFDFDDLESFINMNDLHKEPIHKKLQIPKIMTFEEFNKYIYSKIDPDQAILVTKEMLMKIEKAFIEDFKQDWIKLSRDDKRKKERVIRGLYENCNLIYQNLEANPDKYLRDIKEMIIQKYFKNDEMYNQYFQS